MHAGNRSASAIFSRSAARSAAARARPPPAGRDGSRAIGGGCAPPVHSIPRRGAGGDAERTHPCLVTARGAHIERCYHQPQWAQPWPPYGAPLSI